MTDNEKRIKDLESTININKKTGNPMAWVQTLCLQALLDENAALKERIDEVKMQYEGVKLVNIELQSKLNGYKVIYDSLNERYVRVLKDFSSSNKITPH